MTQDDIKKIIAKIMLYKAFHQWSKNLGLARSELRRQAYLINRMEVYKQLGLYEDLKALVDLPKRFTQDAQTVTRVIALTDAEKQYYGLPV